MKTGSSGNTRTKLCAHTCTASSVSFFGHPVLLVALVSFGVASFSLLVQRTVTAHALRALHNRVMGSPTIAATGATALGCHQRVPSCVWCICVDVLHHLLCDDVVDPGLSRSGNSEPKFEPCTVLLPFAFCQHLCNSVCMHVFNRFMASSTALFDIDSARIGTLHGVPFEPLMRQLVYIPPTSILLDACLGAPHVCLRPTVLTWWAAKEI